MMIAGSEDFNNLIVDMMTYQAFVAGLTHIADMMEGEGLTFQEALLRVLTETCDSEFAFAAIHDPLNGRLRVFASYPNPLPIDMPQHVDAPFLNQIVQQERHDIVKDTSEEGKAIVPGVRCAFAVPYRHWGAHCIVCVCNRNPESYARPNLGVPYVSHEIKMCQALLALRPI
jgi:hypothetical protein